MCGAHALGKIEGDIQRVGVGLRVEDLGSDMGVEPHDVDIRRVHRPRHGLLGRAGVKPEPKLAIHGAGADVFMRVRFHPRREPQEHLCRAAAPPRQFVDDLDFLQRVDDDSTDAQFER